jgi:hypothetical protein
MAYTTIDKPSDYFNTALYTGNGTTQSITSLDFQPDLTWIKGRSDVIAHVLFDSVRGAGGNKEIGSNVTYAEGGNASISYGFLSSFNSDGFSVSQGTSSPYQADYTNKNSSTYASWNWLGGGTAVSNTDGSITSSVSANTTSGFSIVSYTGTGAVGTIGHGLGQLPAMIIFKNRSSATDWMVFHKNSQSSYSFSATAFLTLNLTSAVNGTGVGGVMNDTAPTTSLFTVGNDSRSNGSGNSMIAYCFAEVKGYSKFGSYTGNGSADGTFAYTGFKPAFIMLKRTDVADSWYTIDTGRNTYNVLNKYLFADSSSAEGTDNNMDFLSNGFKLRVATYQPNTSGGTWIYLAIAEQPFVTSTGIPTPAR